MAKQLFYEDVEVDTEIPALAKIATTEMLVRWAGASGDFNPLHYDDNFARTQGVSSCILHGVLKRAWLVQMLTDWIGEEGFLKKLACYYIKADYPRHMKTRFEPEEGETWWCKGKVTGKYEEDDNHCVQCQIWVGNGKGEITTPGSATIILPSKG